ncbi:hypothetical protein [Sulfurimonas sp. NWX367]|uniref:hypothetical protein n=1 Tax=unclassified Sulfurimonas TaxID=2623549 RepID=UPI00320495A4
MIDFINEYFNDKELFFITAKEHPNDFKLSVYKHKYSFKYFVEELKERQELKQSIYFSINTFKYIDGEISRKEDNLHKIKSLFFDFDKDGYEVGNKVKEIFGRPSYIIQTSQDKYQFIYQFDKPIETNFEYIYEISKTLTKYLQEEVFNEDKEKIDNTFDMSRVGRLPNTINAKNGFKVKWWKTDILYSLKYWENLIKELNMKWRTRDEDKRVKNNNKNTLKTVKNKKSIESIDKYDFINYERYLKTYKSIEYNRFKRRKLKIDKSIVDMSFLKRFKNEFESEFGNDIEVIKSILAYCREDLIEKHGHEIERYIENKIRDIY